MGRRRRAREGALQVLFQLEFNSTDLEQTIAQFWKVRKASEEEREYSTWLIRGIRVHLKKIDSLIQSVSAHWRISRMAVVDRNVLRIAVFEMLNEPELARAVVINEAIEIARKYSTDEAASFVNGVLDGVRKKLDQKCRSPKEGNDGRGKRKSTGKGTGKVRHSESK